VINPTGDVMRIKHYALGKFYMIECPESTRIVLNSTFLASGSPEPCDGIVFPFKGKELRIPTNPPELFPLLAESGNFGVRLVGEPVPEASLTGVSCPRCGETDVAWLQLQDDSETVHCDYCGAEFGLPVPSVAPIWKSSRLAD
jgi:ribosomal protein S27E